MLHPVVVFLCLFSPSSHDPSMVGATGFIFGSGETSNRKCSRCLIAIYWVKIHMVGERAISCCQVKWELHPCAQRILDPSYFKGTREKHFRKLSNCGSILFFLLSMKLHMLVALSHLLVWYRSTELISVTKYIISEYILSLLLSIYNKIKSNAIDTFLENVF